MAHEGNERNTQYSSPATSPEGPTSESESATPDSLTVEASPPLPVPNGTPTEDHESPKSFDLAVSFLQATVPPGHTVLTSHHVAQHEMSPPDHGAGRIYTRDGRPDPSLVETMRKALEEFDIGRPNEESLLMLVEGYDSLYSIRRYLAERGFPVPLVAALVEDEEEGRGGGGEGGGGGGGEEEEEEEEIHIRG
ncbi:hypothetical protein MMC19_006568 [Ptychographa xylographoides]|nr:hypothetical protein [Ptychographa xylographoides]